MIIINNYIPSEITKYNIGPGIINIDNNYEKFIITQNWISDNLYFGGMISFELAGSVEDGKNFCTKTCIFEIDATWLHQIFLV